MRYTMWTGLILACAFGMFAGCDGKESPAANWATADEAQYAGAEGTVLVNESPVSQAPLTRATSQPNDASLPIATPAPDAARKIIFNADIDLVVDDFTGVAASVTALARDHGGFVAQSSVHGSAGEPREGSWTLRIPSAAFDQAMQDAEDIGQVRSIQSSSREVTAEYVDLQARLRNKLAEEQRLTRHLEESASGLSDILKIEQELSRVRGEVEVYQGRLNVLTDLTAMSTVQVRVEEIRDYTPAPTEEPGFASQAQRAWAGSAGALGDFFRGVALFAVTLAPWLVLIVPGCWLGWVVLRRGLRRPAA